MNVAHKMDDELERLTLRVRGLASILEHGTRTRELIHGAVPSLQFLTISARIVLCCRDRDVDKMPVLRFWPGVLDLVGPICNVNEVLIAKDRHDLGFYGKRRLSISV